MEYRDCSVGKGCEKHILQPEDLEMLNVIRKITSKGNDAEVRRKRDGTFAVYEIKRNMVSVK